MRKWMIGGVAAAALFSGAALADEVTGEVSSIDLTAMTMIVDDHVFSVDPNNVVGVTLEELSEGDMVHVTYEGEAGSDQFNAMTVEKVE